MTLIDTTATVKGTSMKPKVQIKKRPTLFQYAFGFSARFLSAAAPSLAARWLSTIFRTPQKYHQPPREREWMKDAEVWRIPFDGTLTLPLYSWGQGPTILLVHGLSGRASQMGAFVQPLLEKGFRVVTFDVPAHGNAEGKQTALPEVADAVVKVVQHLGSVDGIIAHSIGSAATTLALSKGMSAKKIVYISPPEDLSGYLQRLARLIGFSPAVARDTQARLEKQSGMIFEHARGRSLAPKMTASALLIHDKGDRMVSYDEGLRLAAAWPNAEFHTTNGLGHSRILRDAEVIRIATNYLHKSNTHTEPSLQE